METAPFGIQVIVVEPGAIRIEWAGIAHESLVGASGDSAYGPWEHRLARTLASMADSRLPSDPKVVAATIAMARAARRPRTRYAIGVGARTVLFLRQILSDRMFDALMWRITQGAGALKAGIEAPTRP